MYRKSSNSINGSIAATLSRKVITYRNAYEDDGRFYYLNDPITTRGEGGTLNARPNLGYTVYYNPETKDKIAVADYNVTLAKTSNDEGEIYTTDNELLCKGYVAIRPPRVRGKLGCWTWALEKFNAQKDEIIITGKPGSYAVRKRTFVKKEDIVTVDGKMQYTASSMTNSRSILDFSTNDGTNTLNTVLGKNAVFSNPKNLEMIKYLIQLVADKSFIVLDFFSGSATTAHAVMQANAEDGGKRRFIMVQISEETEDKSDAYKAGYKTICEIGKERIRRAAKKIAEENPDAKFDSGFRVLKCDTSNMKDVYYSPADFDMNLLDMMADNIKEDRTPEALLFQVMLDLGVELSSKIEETTIAGKKVFDVADGFLIACFDKDVNEETIKAIAQKQPYYFVMRDSSLASDSVATNFEQIFATYSPDTVRKVL